MLIANYYSNTDIRLEDRPIPQIKNGECLIKIFASGICGSDLMEWYRRDSIPLVLGHETAGEVIEVGLGVNHIKPGDRVVVSHHVPCLECRYCQRGHETMCKTLHSTTYDPGGFSQYVRLPEINTRLGVFPIPKNVTYEEASFAEPLACVLRGQNCVGIQKGDAVVVIGSGISGILHIALARTQDAECVIACDINEMRLPWAAKFGADIVTKDADSISDKLLETIGRKADIVILTTGHPDAVQAGFDSAGDGATILLFAPSNPNTTIQIDINKLFFKHDRTVTTTYANSPNDLEEALLLIAEHKVPVADMITHRIALDEIQYGFDLVQNGTESLKVIVEPNRNGTY
ncbi:MAG: alcohol dehydrogenase catalytic domain-containing protein [Anaerolineales bacterium]|jgi:L-iditol 2-dehydrogenase|nr:alcohol dehydrogenase catalytic domain-containing protein [Anaerolineales bacterium]|tara:strand:+ start:1197 stop:2234 length:1038 start_codon:yes stop_codon:yes gene_type:complete